jgi:hypothetical protein
MKKIILIISLVCTALAVGLFMGQSENEVALSDFAKSNVEALGNDLCPNGCTDDEDSGCYCYNWYPWYKEYDKWPPEPAI